MNVFAQKLNYPCQIYSVLLRLYKKHNVMRCLYTLSERKCNTLIYPCMDPPHRTWMQYSVRNCTKLVVHRDVNVKHDNKSAGTFFFSEQMTENEYARNLFINSQKYKQSIMPQFNTHAYITNDDAEHLLEQNWALMKPCEIISAIKKLSYNMHYSTVNLNPLKYRNVFETLIMFYQKLNDADLIKMIQYLVPFSQYLGEYHFYYKLCQQLDKECVNRYLTQLSNDDTLMLCDMMSKLLNKNSSDYLWYSIRKLGNKPSKLTSPQLVQVLFFLNVCRKPPINMYELEYRLERCLDELSVNELGVATLGFFKTSTKIRSKDLLRRIIKKTIVEIDHADNITIGAIFKLIRYSMKLTEIVMLKDLLKTITPHEPRLTLMTLTHIGHSCGRVALYDEEFMCRIIKRLNSELKTARLKDFERLIFILSCFNIKSDVYHNVIEELRATWNTNRAQEIEQHPYTISRILGFMSYMNIYPTDLIQRVMTPEYVHKTCSGNYHHISTEYCVLDYSLRVEVPEYNGPFLKPQILNFVEKKYFQNLQSPESSRTNVLLMNVLQTCQEIFNNTTDISANRLLPHYVVPDIILCLDEQNRLVPTEKFLSSYSAEDIKRVNKEDAKNVRWFALVLAPHGLTIRDTNLPVGPLAAKMRQLSKIGYTPVMISQIDWNEYKTNQERCDFIKNLTFNNNMSELTNK